VDGVPEPDPRGSRRIDRARRRGSLHAEDRLGGAVFGEPKARGPRLTKADARAVPVGLTRKQLRSRVGAPASYGIQRVNDGRDMRCWAYRSPDRHPYRALLHAFCFRDGRYAELTEW
jgi:hypothetical protein